MPYAFVTSFDPERECLLGTRESLICETSQILGNPDEDGPQVCFLAGVAGSSKSAVAHSIARMFNKMKRLGSSYFFDRADVTSRNPNNLFSTIARDLSNLDPWYRSALWGVVKRSRSLRTSPWPKEQVERPIIEPSKELCPIGPIVIVIDALDEIGDRASRHELLDVVLRKLLRMHCQPIFAFLSRLALKRISSYHFCLVLELSAK